eukprot:TRINITY_DN11835_c1_g1_i1.p1 TRINITY_DN11835_c1_g1~~TRINITY_DN11835_c1_g1_i1.p1  ORF type:complete len:249 (-),score=-10.02 TRINITY_DN11835_c1_g1_i1:216-962(-)
MLVLKYYFKHEMNKNPTQKSRNQKQPQQLINNNTQSVIVQRSKQYNFNLVWLSTQICKLNFIRKFVVSRQFIVIISVKIDAELYYYVVQNKLVWEGYSTKNKVQKYQTYNTYLFIIVIKEELRLSYKEGLGVTQLSILYFVTCAVIFDNSNILGYYYSPNILSQIRPPTSKCKQKYAVTCYIMATQTSRIQQLQVNIEIKKIHFFFTTAIYSCSVQNNITAQCKNSNLLFLDFQQPTQTPKSNNQKKL